MFKKDNEVVKNAIEKVLENRNQKSDQNCQIEIERLKIERIKLELELAQLTENVSNIQASSDQGCKSEPEESLDSLIKSVRTLSIKPSSKSQDWGFFFTSLERTYNNKKVPEKFKAEILLNLLGERASNTLTYIEEKDLNNYDKVKSIVLRELEPTAQAVREFSKYFQRKRNSCAIRFAFNNKFRILFKIERCNAL